MNNFFRCWLNCITPFLIVAGFTWLFALLLTSGIILTIFLAGPITWAAFVAVLPAWAEIMLITTGVLAVLFIIMSTMCAASCLISWLFEMNPGWRGVVTWSKEEVKSPLFTAEKFKMSFAFAVTLVAVQYKVLLSLL